MSVTDSHREGKPIPAERRIDRKSTKPREKAKKTADFSKKALLILNEQEPADLFILCGMSHPTDIQPFEDWYPLKKACNSMYPIYIALAQLAGMTKIESAPKLKEQLEM